jgi:exosortase H (IPTLxxWG-CTERM-specific)
MTRETTVAANDASGRARLRFVISFALIAATLFAVYCFPYAENGLSENWFKGYLSAYARMAGAVLGLFERPVIVSGTNISGRFSIEIAKNCDAMEVNILLGAAILAFPSRWTRRFAAAVLGLAVLIAANVARICSLYYIGVYAPSSFEFMHHEVWPLLLVLLAAGEFLLLAAWMRRTDEVVTRAAA